MLCSAQSQVLQSPLDQTKRSLKPVMLRPGGNVALKFELSLLFVVCTGPMCLCA